jgi:hypothetical protein
MSSLPTKEESGSRGTISIGSVRDSGADSVAELVVDGQTMFTSCNN